MFVTPDSIVPGMFDPQDLNRYAYCRNNPLIYVDPSGHKITGPNDTYNEKEIQEAAEQGWKDWQESIEKFNKFLESSRKPLYDLDGNLKDYRLPIANTWDPTTNKNILSLDPQMRAMATAIVNFLQQEYGVLAQINNPATPPAARTLQQQLDIFEQGRKTGKVGDFATKAPPGYSAHNYGLAFDLDIVKGGQKGRVLAENIGQAAGFNWGGNWSFNDPRHFELTKEYQRAMYRAGFKISFKESWGKRCLSDYRDNPFFN
jgi:hypothetical protein